MALDKQATARVKKVRTYISETFPDASESTWSELEEIARLTALRRDHDGAYYISNLWRGPLLYSLVRKLKPRVILELGTGRGYGAFSMAKGLVDGGIDGKLITVDRTPFDREMDWSYVDSDQKSVTRPYSLDKFWNENLPAELNDRIEFRLGDTASVHKLLADQSGNVDMVFIDSDHTYNGVALDFYSTHRVSSSKAAFVFDDYSAASGYGIRKLVDGELSNAFSIQVIDMELTAAHDISVDHMMAVVNGNGQSVDAKFTKPGDARFKYLLLARWIRNRLVDLKRFIKSR